MKKILAFFLFLTLNLTAQTWSPLPNAPNFIGPFSKLDDIHFIDANKGWAINLLGDVYKTQDGGDTWDKLTNLDTFLRCIKFANESVGYTASLNGAFAGGSGAPKMLKTIDGGNTWTDLTASISPLPIGICGLNVLNEQTVYAVGAFYAPARFYKSTDGGATWENKDMSAYANALVDLYFFDANLGFAVGSNSNGGVILKTTNGGTNWSVVYETSLFGDLLWKIQALDNNNIYVSIAGTSITEGARIIISNDAGENWNVKQVAPGEVHLQGVGFLNQNHGFAGGFFDGVYETLDGGDSWQLINVGANYNRFQKISDDLMYASGHTVYKYSNSLSTPNTGEIIPKPLYSMDVYPNPVSDLLNIRYQLPDYTHVNLSIYDITGKKVISIFDGWHTEGEFNITKSIKELPSGTYLVGLLSREGDVLTKISISH